MLADNKAAFAFRLSRGVRGSTNSAPLQPVVFGGRPNRCYISIRPVCATTMATNGTLLDGAGSRGSLVLNQEQMEELSEAFSTIDVNGDGRIQLTELQHALKVVGVDLPGHKVRELIGQYGHGRDSLTVDEFGMLYAKLKSELDVGRLWKKEVRPAEGVIELEGQSEASQAVGIKHHIRVAEQVAFTDWINKNLGSDPDLRKHLPIEQSERLYEAVTDGLVLCKLINLAVPDTIDERVVNKGKLNAFTIYENQTLALNSARAIGCSTVNIHPEDLAKGKPHLVLGLLWQIIRIGLFSQIDLVHVPGLVRLLRDGETLADLQRLNPEQILMRWVNYQMEQAGVDRRLNNFTSDIKDSVIYTHLMKQIAPADRKVNKNALVIQNETQRAEAMLKEADKLDCRRFVTARDVVDGVYKLNLAFVANLFNTWPGLEPPGEDEDLGIEDIQEEPREVKQFRNWMNSMGVDPYVNNLFTDLYNGVIIFQLYDIVKPGIVDWKRVVVQFKKLRAMMDQIQNCNYAVDLGKQLRFSLVGIQGKDIYDGNETLTLALVWQLMRAYTLTVLAQCTHSGGMAAESEIIRWCNEKLRDSGKSSSFKSFQDPSISDAIVVCDLIDAIKPGAIDYDMIRRGGSPEDKLANAKYAVSAARKTGARVYALPEDVVEVRPKMVMTVFACLMARAYSKTDLTEATATKPTLPDSPGQARLED